MFTITDVAAKTGLSVHTLRFYEREGLMLRPVARDAAGRRTYCQDDVDWLTLCIVLRTAGMPLDDVRRYTELVRAGEGNERERLELFRRHEAAIAEQKRLIDQAHDLVRYKIGVYEDVLAAGRDTSPAVGRPGSK